MPRKKNYENYLRKFNRHSAKRQVEILWSALDFMNQYNGRTREECIVLAMCHEDGRDGMDVIDEYYERKYEA